MSYLGTKPANSPLTSELIPDGIITPADLSQGKPVWDANSNLGVGTNNPIEKLHVVGNIVAGGTIFTGDGAITEDTSIELGSRRTGSGNCYIDLHATAGTDFSARMLRGAGANGAFQLSNTGTGEFQINTNGSERMRIDSSGNLLVGTTGTDSANGTGVTLQKYGGGAYITIAHTTSASSGDGFMSFFRSTSTIGSIVQNGTTAVSYNTTSDYRLKENIQPLSNALAKVQALKPCTYTWKSAPDEIGEGFIAHELAEVCPQAVSGEKDAVNEDGTIKAQSIDTSFLVATLTAAIQEQQVIITELKARIEALESK